MIVAIVPGRDEPAGEPEATAHSALAAGADQVVLIDDGSEQRPIRLANPDPRIHLTRNQEPLHPAAVRNQGFALACALGATHAIYSDAHCRFLGSLLDLCAIATSVRGVACAATRTRDTGREVGYGAHWSHYHKWPVPRVVWNTRRPATEVAAVTAICGSVYAAQVCDWRRVGSPWPETIANGYNEAAISWACLRAGVPMVVARDIAQQHLFRRRHPFQVRGLHQSHNMALVPYILCTEDTWCQQWRPRFDRYRSTLHYVRARKSELLALRDGWERTRQVSDSQVLQVMERDAGPWSAPAPQGVPGLVVGMMAIAPRLYPDWRLRLRHLVGQVGGIVVRLDSRQSMDLSSDLEAIREDCGAKLHQVVMGTATWNRWNWREEMLAAASTVRPEIILQPDQDEEIHGDWRQDVERLRVSYDDMLMLSYDMAWDGAGERPRLYPGAPHCKIFRWRPGMSFGPVYAGFARPWCKAGIPAKHCRVLHYSHQTAELAAAHVRH